MATVNLQLKPITVPNYVIVAERSDATPTSISVKDLPANTLHELAAEFRRGLFAKAGKRDPLADAGRSA